MPAVHLLAFRAWQVTNGTLTTNIPVLHFRLILGIRVLLLCKIPFYITLCYIWFSTTPLLYISKHLRSLQPKQQWRFLEPTGTCWCSWLHPAQLLLHQFCSPGQYTNTYWKSTHEQTRTQRERFVTSRLCFIPPSNHMKQSRKEKHSTWYALYIPWLLLVLSIFLQYYWSTKRLK